MTNTDAATTEPAQREHRFQALLETASAAIVVVTPEWELIDFNDAWCDFLGYERHELLGLSPRDLTHPDDRSESQRQIDALLGGRHDAYRFEKRYLRKTGDVVWGDISAKAIQDEDGAVDVVVATIVDITALKENQRRLEASEARIRDFAMASTDWFWEQDRDLRFTEILDLRKERFTDLAKWATGKTRWEAAGGDPAVDPLWRDHVAELRAHRDFRDFQYSIVDDHGTTRVLSVSGKAIFDADETFAGYRGTARDVTDVVETKSANQRFMDALDRLDEGLALWGADEKLVLSNKLLRDASGKVGLELKPGIAFRTWLEVQLDAGAIPEAAGHEDEWLAGRLDSFRNPSGALEVLRDGLWYRLRFQKLPDGSTLQSAFDIDALKRSETALREREQLLSHHIENAPLAAITWDANFRCTEWNPAAEEIFGYRRDEAIGKTGQELIVPDAFQPVVADMFAAVLKANGGERSEIANRTRDGRIIACQWFNTPLRNARGDIVGVASLAQDVTHEREAQAALVREEKFRQQVLKTTQEGYLYTAPGGVTLDVNPAMCAILGRSRADIVGRPVYDFVDGANRAIFETQLANRKRGDAASYEIALQRPDGSAVSCINNAAPIFDEKGRHVGSVGLWTDITELKRIQQASEKANEAKSRFLSSMSHELRTPLNAVIGFGQLLRLDYQHLLDENGRECLDQILSSSEMLLKLIDQVLDLAKIEQGMLSIELADVDICAVVAASIPILRTAASTMDVSLTFVRETCQDAHVRADEVRLRQVLLNLLSNAIKYNRQGGKVLVFAERKADGFLKLNVRDTGTGIPRSRYGDVFVEFARLGREALSIEGTGVGLSICKTLIEAMDGTIGFDSEEGKGSTFWISLPLAGAAT